MSCIRIPYDLEKKIAEENRWEKFDIRQEIENI